MRDPWTEAMLDGAFEQAWRISDAVLRQRAGQSCAHLPHHLRWVWDGTPLDERRVLVRCYHGLGDTLQFIRFVPALARRARSVIVEAQPELLPLLRSVGGAEALLPLDATPPPFDVEIESMELPHALRMTSESLPGKIPYLATPWRRGAVARHSHPGRLRVGLVWRAGNWRTERSLPLSLLAPVARLPLSLVNLQLGAARTEALSQWFASAIAEDSSMAQTATVIEGLDLVITVDSMAAHLAGALGRPVWLLLDAEADWRWQRARSDSPWYPTMRLFRQAQPGHWERVVAAVAAALQEVLQRRQAERRPARPRSGDRGDTVAAGSDDGTA